VLSPYRVLDLADGRGAFCGKLLSDLGADVIKVEPPSGDPARRIGPFYQDDPHPEKSLFWACFAGNKRSITLNLEKDEGRRLLLRLVESSNFLVESFRPGYLDDLDLGFEALSKVNPLLIMVSITPFGQDGPYRSNQATDLIGMALSGMMYLTGDTDRPPVRVTTPQFWVVGGAAGAAGAMIANHYRHLTGKGQHVDVSCQQAMARGLSHAPMIWDMDRMNMKRQGPFRPVGDVNLPINWSCSDGYINFIQPGGHTGGRSMRNLSDWMDEEGFGQPVLRDTNWGDIGFGRLSQELVDQMTPPLVRFFQTKTKRELAQGALSRRILLFPVNDPKDVFEYPQLEARNFFQEVEAPMAQDPGVTLKVLGPFIQTTLEPKAALRRAPRLGEHNQEIYGNDLGLTEKEISRLKEAQVL
jgi:crotonobetainyl-CoA:carnitine CoA-transferase CaiB-like acyl-CoA transferase